MGHAQQTSNHITDGYDVRGMYNLIGHRICQQHDIKSIIIISHLDDTINTEFPPLL